MFRSQYMYLPYMGCSDLSTCASLIWKVQISAHVPSLCGTFSAQCCPYTIGLKKGLYPHPTFYSVSCTVNSSKHPPVSCEMASGTQVYASVRVCRNSGKNSLLAAAPVTHSKSYQISFTIRSTNLPIPSLSSKAPGTYKQSIEYGMK